MFSKFSRVIMSYPIRFSALSATHFTKSINNYRNCLVPERSFHWNRYELQKINTPKTNSKTKKPADVSAQSIGYYSMAVVVLCAGLTFAAVPLYRLFCQVRNVLFQSFKQTNVNHSTYLRRPATVEQ